MFRKIVLVVIAFATLSFSGITFGGFGAGADMSFTLAQKPGWYETIPVVAFGAGLQGYLDFQINDVFEFQYYPSITFWVRGGTSHGVWDSGVEWDDYNIKDGTFALNIFDMKYMFPVPKDLKVKPYAGWGPTILVQRWHYRYTEHSAGEPDYISEARSSWLDYGTNMFAGIDIPFAPSFLFFGEVRGTFSDKDSFKMTAGLYLTF